MAAAVEQGRAISRREFVQGLPMDMKASEVVRRAKQVGLKMKEHDVYTTRYKIRQQQQATPPRRRGRPPGSKNATTSQSDVIVRPESKERSLLAAARRARFLKLDAAGQLKWLVKQMGTIRALEIVQAVEAETAIA